MKEKTNLKRIVSLCKWNIGANRKEYIKVFSVLFIVNILMQLISGKFKGLLNFNPSWHLSRSFAYYGNIINMVMATLVFLVLIIIPTMSMSTIKKKESRIRFLTLPATQWEKFLSLHITTFITTVASFIISYIIVDVIMYILGVFMGYGSETPSMFHVHNEVAPVAKFEDITPIQGIELTALIYILCMLCHSFFSFCGSLFRKHTALFSALFLMLIWLIVGLAFSMILPLVPDFEDKDDFFRDNNWVCLIPCGLFLLLSVVFYFLSYKIFKRYDVRNESITNL